MKKYLIFTLITVFAFVGINSSVSATCFVCTDCKEDYMNVVDWRTLDLYEGIGCNCVYYDAIEKDNCNVDWVIEHVEGYTKEDFFIYKEGATSVNTDGCAVLTPDLIEKLNWALNILKYAGAILAILLGMLDFFKATISDDDGATKKASKRFIKRLIAAALIFIIPSLVQFILTTVKIPGVNVDSVTCGVGIDESI